MREGEIPRKISSSQPRAPWWWWWWSPTPERGGKTILWAATNQLPTCFNPGIARSKTVLVEPARAEKQVGIHIAGRSLRIIISWTTGNAATPAGILLDVQRGIIRFVRGCSAQFDCHLSRRVRRASAGEKESFGLVCCFWGSAGGGAAMEEEIARNSARRRCVFRRVAAA